MYGFFPGKKYGGPPVSVDNFCSLMEKFESYIVCLNHDMDTKVPYSNIEKGWNQRSNAKIFYLSDADFCYKSFLKIAKALHPDFIYLQGLFQQCVLPSLLVSKRLNVKIMLAPRGELCKGAFDKKWKKIPYIIFLRMFGLMGNASFQVTSDEEYDSIKKYLGVAEDRIYYLPNIPSLPRLKPQSEPKKQGVGHFVFISRIVPKKNLLKCVHYFKNIKGKAFFHIYGPIEEETYWKECEEEIRSLPSNIQVEYKGLVDHEHIHEVFGKYDAFLFPTRSENFGHVIAESLLARCPVIISDQTPWTDVNGTGAGWALSLDKDEEFLNAINYIIDCNDADMSEHRHHAEKYVYNKLQIEKLRDSYYKAFGV